MSFASLAWPDPSSRRALSLAVYWSVPTPHLKPVGFMVSFLVFWKLSCDSVKFSAKRIDMSDQNERPSSRQEKRKVSTRVNVSFEELESGYVTAPDTSEKQITPSRLNSTSTTMTRSSCKLILWCPQCVMIRPLTINFLFPVLVRPWNPCKRAVIIILKYCYCTIQHQTSQINTTKLMNLSNKARGNIFTLC